MRRLAVLDAPSNLGLRPPTATSVPGCAKAPGALRDQGLVARLDARDAGCVTPPRYDPGDWRPGDGVAHADQIVWYSRRLADRIGALLDAGEFPVVLGGDCSVLLGSALAMSRRATDVDGRFGLVYVDGHSDFRHPGNASYVGAAAGEDLALATGRGQGDLAAMENRRPYFQDSDVVVLGIRTHDEHRLDLHAAGIAYRAVPQLRAEGAARSAQWARGLLGDCVGYWVHVDVDVLDPAVMPAVDAPDPGGIAYTELELLIAGLVATPHCLGIEITVFDPDYDPTGVYAAEIVETLVAGLAPAGTVVPLDWAALASGKPEAALASGKPEAALAETPAPFEVPLSRVPGDPAGESPEPASEMPPVAAEAPVEESAAVAEPAAVDEDEQAGERYRAARRTKAGDRADDGEQRDQNERRPTGGRAPMSRGRSALDRLNFSDMVDADRLALSKRRSGGVPLRRRESPAETTPARAERDSADPDSTSGGEAAEASRPFAGLAEQVRAAGSGQVPAARSPVDPSVAPAAPPAETA
jgi:arginase